MTIIRKPPKSLDEFIAKAPDSRDKGVSKDRKVQISLTIPRELLEDLDNLAASVGQSRAAMINMAVYQLIHGGLKIPAARD